MLKPEAFDDVVAVGLLPVHFYADANKRVFGSIVALHEQGQPFDNVTVASRLHDMGQLGATGGTPYLARLTDATPSIAHVTAHAKRVRDLHQLRHMITVLQTAEAEGYGPIEDLHAWFDDLEHTVSGVARRFDDRRGLVSIGDAAAGAYDHITDDERAHELSTPLGFRQLDEHLGGGPKNSDLFVVAARPGMGKTAWALDVALNVGVPKRRIEVTEPEEAWGHRTEKEIIEPGGGVAFFSLEMDELQIAIRALCREKGLDSRRLISGRIRKHEHAPLVDGVQWLQQVALWVDDTPGLSLADIRSRARKLQGDIARGVAQPRASSLRLVVVDYLQIMGGEQNRNQNREEFVSQLAKGLKALAKELKVPVMALSQLNRSLESRSKKEPMLSDLRESGSIEQEADEVMFLHRPEYFDKDDEPGVTKCLIQKHRAGPLGTIRLRFVASHTRFYPLEDDFDDIGEDA